ncbi:magnesium/cobalt transporter CorA [Brevibacillus composti]|uniref:Magnesium transport protein CorA n=1 Tax=Brevibacillus composti TaxID=2796470 RepID=A0A7T5JP98_9BACL|nr:magnesium/cobalt transporter CorA [Brevibacillus composti]QQE75253.1 magnesium/cobalt transporter CorA [Brevibacillus composti]QUO42280.1 magnesium/cobalt transporter CorA [Brevibacillus composti]
MKIRLVQNGLITLIDDIEQTQTPPNNGFYWIDASLFDLAILQPLFGLHDLAIEDCIDEEEQRPKLEIYEDHYFIVINSVELADQDIFLHEVNLFLGGHYVITVTKHDIGLQPRMLQIVREKEINHADSFLYYLVDHIVERYFDVIEKIEDLIEKLEEEILVNAKKTQLHQIIGLRSEVLYARKMLLPQRELIDALHKKDLPLIDKRLRKYFGDLLEDAVKIVESFETFRELIGNLREAYHSSVAGRANDIMRIFTALTTIFMPLTIVTGIYGMNFDYMPELRSPHGYYIVLAFMAALGAVMYLIFKRKEWL